MVPYSMSWHKIVKNFFQRLLEILSARTHCEKGRQTKNECQFFHNLIIFNTGSKMFIEYFGSPVNLYRPKNKNDFAKITNI